MRPLEIKAYLAASERAKYDSPKRHNNALIEGRFSEKDAVFIGRREVEF